MMIKLLKKIAVMTVAIAVASGGNCLAADSLARTDFFREGVSARAFGIGGAFGALADDAGASYWNPAGLYLLNSGEFYTTRSTKDIFDITTQTLNAALPAGKGMSALNVVYSTSGNFLLTKTDPATGRLIPDRIIEENDSGMALSYAWPSRDDLFVGATMKSARQKLGGASASGWGFDIGAIYQYDYATRLSLAVQNIGDMEVGTDVIPMNVKIGAMRKFERDRLAIATTYDFNYLEDEFFSIGAEYAVEDTFFARVGSTDGDFSAGLGFAYEDFKVDYAFRNDDSSGDEQKLTIGYMIESSRKRMPERKDKLKPAPAPAPVVEQISVPERKPMKEKEVEKPEPKKEEKATEKPSKEEKKKEESSSTRERRGKSDSKDGKKKDSDKETPSDKPEEPSIQWETPPAGSKKDAEKAADDIDILISPKRIAPTGRPPVENEDGEIPATGEYFDPLSLPMDYGAMSGETEQEDISFEGLSGEQTMPLEEYIPPPVDLNQNWWPEPKEEGEAQFGLDPN